MHRDKEITPMLVFAIFSAVLGMFQFGYNTGVINAPQKVLEEFIANIYKSRTGNWISEEVRDIIWSVTVSIFAVGGMIGGLIAPIMANWCGRKTGLLLNNIIAILGVTLMSSSQLSQSIEFLIIGRFFIGLNCGLSTALVPMYLTEIATVSLRGALGTVSQLGVTIGLLMSQILGLKEILGTKEYWPFLFGFAFIPTVLQLIMLPFCPESPRYLLLSCGRVSEARLSLRRLRNSVNIEYDMEEMRAEERAQEEEVRQYGKLSTIRELINHPWLRAPLIIGVMMQLSQQLSGINAIFYYSTDIFLSAEVPEDYAVYATMGVGLVMVVMTLVSVPMMDRLGRRTLHLFGLGGMFLASIFLTISLLVKFLYDWMKYISVLSILFYALFFGIGPGSLPWMITAELFTQGSRPTAMSISVLVNWFTNFVVGLTFPLMKRVLQSYLFLPFTVFLAIFWIFTYKKLPETKNRTFEEIAALFRPIQLASSDLMGAYSQFGCNLGNLSALAQPPGSLNNTPLALCQQQPAPLSGPIASGGNRFRFDAASIGDLAQAASLFGQQEQGCGPESAGCQAGGLHCPRGSIHSHNTSFQQHQPHTSCTSIPQNLSTSDQQPLIADAQSDRCLHHQLSLASQPRQGNQHHHLHHQHESHLQHAFPLHQTLGRQLSRHQLERSQNELDRCGCLGVSASSFLSKKGSLECQPAGLRTGCTCCEHELPVQQQAAGWELAKSPLDATLGTIYRARQPEQQVKSRTLTRVYKPLNDVELRASASNLVGNPADEQQYSRARECGTGTIRSIGGEEGCGIAHKHVAARNFQS